jgi:hypothetical protein
MERRASDASVLGMSMEARMARIEGMMESLVQERGVSATPRGSMERDEAVGDGFLSEAAMQAASDLFGPHLARAQRASSKLASPERTRHSMSAMSLSNGADSPATIRVGSSSFPFPHPADYQRYIDFLFTDLSAYYPCINEAEFRIRSEQMLATQAIHSSDVCFLALHYIAFACSDIAVDAFPVSVGGSPPGWHWFQAANDLVGQRELSGRGDLSLIQYLIIKVSSCIQVSHAFADNLDRLSDIRRHSECCVQCHRNRVPSVLPVRPPSTVILAKLYAFRDTYAATHFLDDLFSGPQDIAELWTSVLHT